VKLAEINQSLCVKGEVAVDESLPKGNALSPQGIKGRDLICLRLSAKAKQACWIFQTDFSKLASSNVIQACE